MIKAWADLEIKYKADHYAFPDFLEDLKSLPLLILGACFGPQLVTVLSHLLVVGSVALVATCLSDMEKCHDATLFETNVAYSDTISYVQGLLGVVSDENSGPLTQDSH